MRLRLKRPALLALAAPLSVPPMLLVLRAHHLLLGLDPDALGGSILGFGIGLALVGLVHSLRSPSGRC